MEYRCPRITLTCHKSEQNRPWKLTVLILFVLGISFRTFLPVPGLAQDLQDSQTGSRIEWIKEQQEQKARNLQPAAPPKAEQAMKRFIGDDPLNRYLGGIPGFYLRLGGLSSGGGFGLGPEYHRPDLARGRMSFRVFAAGSMKKWYLLETELRFPHISGSRLDLDILGRRADANSIDYYGPGHDSVKSGHSNYRREENKLAIALAFKPARNYFSVGAAAGYLWLNTGSGQSELSASSEKLYSADMAPGIDKQTHYLQTGLFFNVDTRDRANHPRSGTRFRVELNRFDDRKHDQYSFQQIKSSIEQYLSFFNMKRVIALRVRAILSYPFHGNEVPFYMQPTLGGPSDLRGYRRYRFHDDNSFVANAEYRWEVFTAMDAAVFADAGRVFHRDRDFDLQKMETDAGFGIRFKSREAVVFRIDTAFSQEGIGLWFIFDHVF